MKNPTFNCGFLKKIPNIEIKVESSILKIYKKSAINITLTAENLYAFPLRSAIKKECLVSPFNLYMCLLVIWHVNVTSGFGTWKCESRFVIEVPLTCPGRVQDTPFTTAVRDKVVSGAPVSLESLVIAFLCRADLRVETTALTCSMASSFCYVCVLHDMKYVLTLYIVFLYCYYWYSTHCLCIVAIVNVVV